MSAPPETSPDAAPETTPDADRTAASHEPDGILHLIEERERAGSISWPLYFLLAPVTFWLHSLIGSSFLLARHERTMTDVPATGTVLPESASGPARRVLERVGKRARGEGRGLALARWVAVGFLVGAAVIALLPLAVAFRQAIPLPILRDLVDAVFGSYMHEDEILACLAIAGYIAAVTLLAYLAVFHRRLAGHESAVVQLRLLAELPPVFEAERILADHANRWRWTIAIDVIYAVVLLIPCHFGVLLLLYPAVLLWPLARHLQTIPCNVTAERLSSSEA